MNEDLTESSVNGSILRRHCPAYRESRVTAAYLQRCATLSRLHRLIIPTCLTVPVGTSLVCGKRS